MRCESSNVVAALGQPIMSKCCEQPNKSGLVGCGKQVCPVVRNGKVVLDVGDHPASSGIRLARSAICAGERNPSFFRWRTTVAAVVVAAVADAVGFTTSGSGCIAASRGGSDVLAPSNAPARSSTKENETTEAHANAKSRSAKPVSRPPRRCTRAAMLFLSSSHCPHTKPHCTGRDATRSATTASAILTAPSWAAEPGSRSRAGRGWKPSF